MFTSLIQIPSYNPIPLQMFCYLWLLVKRNYKDGTPAFKRLPISQEQGCNFLPP